MKGQFFEMIFYPYFLTAILFTVNFLMYELSYEIQTTRQVLDAYSSAVDVSNLELLSCIPDHTKVCNITENASFPVERLYYTGNVKRLIYRNKD